MITKAMRTLKTAAKWAAYAAGCAIFALTSLILVRYAKLPDPSSLAAQNPHSTSFMELRRQKALRSGRDFELKWKWIPLAEAPASFLRTLILREDEGFWEHQGVEWREVGNALEHLWKRQRVVTGGSTLTQQVVKNLYLSPERSFVRKGVELFAALEFERRLDKERILELYINIIELGEGVFGLESAAEHWFHCHAHELTPMQAVQLVLMIPAPLSRNPSRPSPQRRLLGNRILVYLLKEGVITPEELQESYLLPDSFQEGQTVSCRDDISFGK
jgi:monofunctional biosynthetic peptidoglycan transglycosylase